MTVNVDDGVLGSWAARQSSIPSGQPGRLLPCQYKGGEERRTKPGMIAHVAVAGKLAIEFIICRPSERLLGRKGSECGICPGGADRKR